MKNNSSNNSSVIYLIRHGEYANPKQIAPYRLPGFHLTENGKQEVSRLSEQLSQEPIVAVYTSPLERTQETAGILAKPHGLQPVIDDRLIEVRSQLEGHTIDEINRNGGWNWDVYTNPVWKGGETLEEIFARVNTVVEEKIKQFKGKSIILVTHGDPVMLIAAQYMGIPRTIKALASIQPYVQMGTGFRMDFEGDSKTVHVSRIILGKK